MSDEGSNHRALLPAGLRDLLPPDAETEAPIQLPESAVPANCLATGDGYFTTSKTPAGGWGSGSMDLSWSVNWVW